jgi:hypothetical protein
MQGLWLLALRRSSQQTAMVRKGSPVRVRQRALKNRAKTRFSRFWSGSYDHFRAPPSDKGSSMAAGRRCAAVRWTVGRFPFSAKVPTRYTTGAKLCWDRRPNGGEAFDADQRARSRQPHACFAWGGLSPWRVRDGSRRTSTSLHQGDEPRRRAGRPRGRSSDRGFAAPAISPNGSEVYVVHNEFTTPFQHTTATSRSLVGVVLHADTGGTGPTGAFTEP